MSRGRPKGSRNKRTALAQAILDQYMEPIIKKCVSKALEGNPQALALCMERILPTFRGSSVRVRMPKLEQIADIDLAQQRIFDSVAKGDMPPAEGVKMLTMSQNLRDNIQDREIEARLTKLEKQAYPNNRQGFQSDLTTLQNVVLGNANELEVT